MKTKDIIVGIIILLLHFNCMSQVSGNMTGDPKEYFTAYSDKEISRPIQMQFTQDDEPFSLYNPNLFRDDCGQWYRRETIYGVWEKQYIKLKEPEAENKIIHGFYNPCNPPRNYSNIEYRLNPETMFEWKRVNTIIFNKL